MEIPKVVPAQLAMRKKAARNAVNVAISYENTSRKLQRMGALYDLAWDYKLRSIAAWDEVEELYSELARFKERMKILEPECWSDLECRIYDV